MVLTENKRACMQNSDENGIISAPLLTSMF